MTATDRRRRIGFSELATDFAHWRNRLVGSRRFQRWAARFPLTRGFARRDGERLFDLMAGFVYSQTLQACVELGVLHRLRTGPLHPAELATQIALTEDRTTTLCQGAAALDLLERRRDGKFQLGRLGAAVLGVPGLEAMILHHRMYYRDLSDPVSLLRGDSDSELAHFWPYVFGATAEIDGAAATAYSDLMASSQALVAEEVLRSVRLSGVSRLMDVGGGTGAFLAAVAADYPDLRLTLFDLPAVTSAAAPVLENRGLAARIDLVGGSFRTDPLPEGADAISLVRVLYDHDDETVTGLLARSAAALPVGGRLVIAEPMSGGARPSRFGDGYFALYTMAMRTGHVRSPERIAQLLREAGFGDVKFPRTLRPFVTSIVTARKAR